MNKTKEKHANNEGKPEKKGKEGVQNRGVGCRHSANGEIAICEVVAVVVRAILTLANTRRFEQHRITERAAGRAPCVDALVVVPYGQRQRGVKGGGHKIHIGIIGKIEPISTT